MTARSLVVAIVGSAALAACSPARRPAPAPAPAPAGAPARDPVVDRDAASRAAAAGAAAVVRTADSIRVSVSDVARGARGVFGDSVDAVAGDPENGPSWDIDVESYVSQDRVEYFVRMFGGRARERIEERLSRGTRYEPMIRQRLREGGLPEDMYYLALVESGFDPHAYSRAAAVGMWQFMTSTGRDMGLRIDWWVDERRDPVRSTRAAVRFIRGLRDQFGSLYLAAAAYNGGPGRVARGLAQFKDELEGQEGEDVFFALAEQDWLRKETKDYVPQLIAAAIVAKDPERYGMSIRQLPPFAYDSVRVGPESAVPAIARAAGTTVAALQDLNPQLLRGVTPPRTEWMVRIPPGTRARFDSAWARMPIEERDGLRRVETRKGLALEEVAADHGITYRQLVAYNPGIKRTKKGRVLPGQALVVPTAAVVAAALVVPDPEIERYGSTPSRSTKGAKRSALEFHVVKRGETLSHIARRYGTTVARLEKLNHLRKPIIFPGQSLVVRGEVPAAGRSAKGGRKGELRVVQAGRASGPSDARGDDGDEDAPSASAAKSSRAASAKAGKSSSTRSAKSARRSASASAKAGAKGKAKAGASKARTGAAKASAKASASKSTKSSKSSKGSAASKSAKAKSAGEGKAGGAAKKKGAAPKDGARKSKSRKSD